MSRQSSFRYCGSFEQVRQTDHWPASPLYIVHSVFCFRTSGGPARINKGAGAQKGDGFASLLLLARRLVTTRAAVGLAGVRLAVGADGGSSSLVLAAVCLVRL